MPEGILLQLYSACSPKLHVPTRSRGTFIRGSGLLSTSRYMYLLEALVFYIPGSDRIGSGTAGTAVLLFLVVLLNLVRPYYVQL